MARHPDEPREEGATFATALEQMRDMALDKEDETLKDLIDEIFKQGESHHSNDQWACLRAINAIHWDLEWRGYDPEALEAIERLCRNSADWWGMSDTLDRELDSMPI